MECLKRAIETITTEQELEQCMSLINKKQRQLYSEKKQKAKEHTLQTVKMPDAWHTDATKYISEAIAEGCTFEEIAWEAVMNTKEEGGKPLFFYSVEEPEIQCNNSECWFSNNEARRDEHEYNFYHALDQGFQKCNVCFDNMDSDDEDDMNDLLQKEAEYFVKEMEKAKL